MNTQVAGLLAEVRAHPRFIAADPSYHRVWDEIEHALQRVYEDVDAIEHFDRITAAVRPDSRDLKQRLEALLHVLQSLRRTIYARHC